MELKNKIAIIGKKLDIIKSKTLGFMAMAGGSWIYAIKSDVSIYKSLDGLEK
jgi:hypothetical protein